MRYLFWLRVKTVMQYIEKTRPSTCLDFGCGLGVMIPFLTTRAASILALDLDTELLQKIGEEQKWKNVSYFHDLSELNSFRGKIDLIIAMDVLEHVDDLDQVLKQFSTLLSKNGSILITGPTENILYKIGRKLAHYSGEYHVRNIYDILKAAGSHFNVSHYRTLFPVLPFFEISVASRKKDDE